MYFADSSRGTETSALNTKTQTKHSHNTKSRHKTVKDKCSERHTEGLCEHPSALCCWWIKRYLVWVMSARSACSGQVAAASAWLEKWKPFKFPLSSARFKTNHWQGFFFWREMAFKKTQNRKWECLLKLKKHLLLWIWIWWICLFVCLFWKMNWMLLLQVHQRPLHAGGGTLVYSGVISACHLICVPLWFQLRHGSLCFTHLCDAVWTDFGQAGAEVQASFDPFLSLASVAEPDSDHLLLQVEAFSYPSYFLRWWLVFFHKAVFQSLLSS